VLVTILHRISAFARDHPKVIDPAVALLVAVLSVTAAAGGQCLSCDPALRGLDALGYGLLIAASASLAWMRRAPLAVFGANLLLMGTYLALDYTEAYTGYSVFVAVLAVASHRPLPVGIAVWATCLTVIFVFREPHFGFELLNVVQISALTFAVALGAYLRTRWAYLEVLGDRARLAEHEAELMREQALARQRGRIARELHDVVAHSMSVVALQIGGARLTMTRDPARADDALARAERATREAMSELRRLLGVLRPEVDGDGLAPQPGVAAIEPLLENARGAGLRIGHRLEGAPLALPAALELSVFRIVQESVTNALRHAGPGAELEVVVRYGPDWVEVEAVDAGSELSTPSAAAGSADAGHGLIGMRERVEMFGGELSAGPLPSGGFRVLARLPVPEEPAPDAPAPGTPPAGG
jgi:signal transduction histidine kinase